MPAPPRILFFPGLGCDHRVIEPHRPIHASIEVQEWIQPRGNESLATYSRRMAERLDTRAPFYLAGISLGGMVALEVADSMRSNPNLRGVILIATCWSNRGIPSAYRLATWFAGRSPMWLVRIAKHVLPHFRRLFGIREAADVELFDTMLRDADPAFIRWSLRSLFDWRGVRSLDQPTFQIHGGRDYILPLRLVGPVDVVVEGAGHALNISHARQVNDAINQWLADRTDAPSIAPV